MKVYNEHSNDSTATISGNTISGNSFGLYHRGGIYVEGGTAIISDNTSSDNSATGIRVDDVIADISFNNIRNNTADNGSGIHVYSSITADISGNIITDNIATGGVSSCTVFVRGPSLFNYNDIFNNTATYELWNDGGIGSKVDATNNWWGTSVESEIQAIIYDWFDDASKGVVDYNPYLDSPNEIEPDISASPTSLDFGSIDVGSGSEAVAFTVSNNGLADLVISGVSLAGTDPGEFAITGDTCSGAAVAPGESCEIDVVFSPTDAAAMSASLAIDSNDPDTPELNIGLSGTGVDVETSEGKGKKKRKGKN